MDFGQLLDSILGADWLSNFLQIVTGAIAVIISWLFAKLKNKFISSQNEHSKEMSSINLKLAKSEEDNQKLKEQQEQTTEAITSLCNIVAMSFLDSKGVSSETKLAISSVIGKLQDAGMNLEPVNKLTEHVTEKVEATVEEVNKIKEDVEVTIETAKENVEGIAEDTVNLYNKIINEQ